MGTESRVSSTIVDLQTASVARGIVSVSFSWSFAFRWAAYIAQVGLEIFPKTCPENSKNLKVLRSSLLNQMMRPNLLSSSGTRIVINIFGTSPATTMSCLRYLSVTSHKSHIRDGP